MKPILIAAAIAALAGLAPVRAATEMDPAKGGAVVITEA